MISPGESLTGSFDHGVIAFCCALIDQVKPPPSVDVMKPNEGIGDDVDPWRRCALAAVEHRQIFAALLREAAHAVEEFHRRIWQRCLGHALRIGTLGRRKGAWFHLTGRLICSVSVPLLPVSMARADASNRFARLRRYLIRAQDEDGTPRTVAGQLRHRLVHTHQRVECALEIHFFYQDSSSARSLRTTRSNGELLEPPIFVRAQKLAHELEIVIVLDADQNDGEVAGNAVRPQSRCLAHATPDDICRRRNV